MSCENHRYSNPWGILCDLINDNNTPYDIRITTEYHDIKFNPEKYTTVGYKINFIHETKRGNNMILFNETYNTDSLSETIEKKINKLGEDCNLSILIENEAYLLKR